MTRALTTLLLSASLVATQSRPFDAAQRNSETFDAIVRHGTVIDGSGRPRYAADVGVINGQMARVGNLADAHAAIDIDATGLFVAPGFINIHSHASPDALARAENMLTQGVTTEIVNPDGGGSTDLAQQLSRAAAPGLALNIGAYIGFNSVWAQVVGLADRRPTDADVKQMQALVVSGLEHGAWGVSAGLDYKPAYYAQVEEVVRIVDPARRWRTNFPNHDRLTPESHFSSRVGVGETIAVGEKAGLLPVVTHMKAQGIEQGTAGQLLAAMQAATRRGAYTAADAYPYLAGQSGLGALLIPAWAQDGGREAMLQRFGDPALRAKIVAETEQAMTARFGGPQGVFLPATKRELVDVMREQNAGAGETVVRLLEQGSMSAILRFGAETDLVKILQHPTTSISCDCGASTETRQHPRAFGTFPRVLGHYVRETKALTWEDAIRKMTALPASTIGMVDRGYVATGMAADLTVFDPNTVIDRSTYDDPGHLSEGIRYVLVNGRVALRDGAVTGEQAGRVLARTAHMPSRPMNGAAPRRLVVRGTMSDGARVAIDLSQAPGAAQANGIVRVTAADGKTALSGTELGVLQTARDWASVTARTADARVVTLIIERADPFADGHPTTVTLDVDGAGPVTTAIARRDAPLVLR